MPLVSRQNLNRKRGASYIFLNFGLFILFKKSYICGPRQLYFIYYFSKYYLFDCSIAENSPNAKEKKSGGEIEVCTYKSYFRNIFNSPVSAK